MLVLISSPVAQSNKKPRKNKKPQTIVFKNKWNSQVTANNSQENSSFEFNREQALQYTSTDFK